MSNEEFIALLRKNIVAVACVVLCLALGGVAYLRSDEEPQAGKVLDERQAEGERLATNIENSAQLHEQLAALTAANDGIEGRIIDPVQLAENQRYFYRLESDTGTKITELRQLPPRPPPRGAPQRTAFIPVGFVVTVQGEYAAVMDFLRQVEGGPLYCHVTSCALRPVGSAERGGPLLMSIELDLLGKS